MTRLAALSRFASDDIFHAWVGHTPMPGKSAVTPLTGCVHSSSFFDLCCRKFGQIVFFATGSICSIRLASLLAHVLKVIGACADKQMGRIHAGRIITLMTDYQVIINWPECKNISSAMCRRSLVWMPLIAKSLYAIQRENTIAVCVSLCQPQPTLIWPTLIYLAPKSLFDRSVRSVALSKETGLTLDNAASCAGSRKCSLSASAFAKSIWYFIVHIFLISKWYAHIIPVNKVRGNYGY